MPESAEDKSEPAAREAEEDTAAQAEADMLLEQLPSGCRESERLLALCRLLSKAHMPGVPYLTCPLPPCLTSHWNYMNVVDSIFVNSSSTRVCICNK